MARMLLGFMTFLGAIILMVSGSPTPGDFFLAGICCYLLWGKNANG